MCASDADARQSRAAADDVWADSDSGGSDAPGDSPARTQLDREWEARKQQFYNVSSLVACRHVFAGTTSCQAVRTLH